MKKVDIGSDLVEGRIVSEARKSFLSLGFGSVTMDDLAEKMGMSKKTFYKYFPGKEFLLKAVIQHKLNSVEADIQKISLDELPDIQSKISAIMDCMMRHASEVSKPFVRDIQKFSPECFSIIEKKRKELINKHVKKLIEEGIRSKEIRSDIPVNLALEILIGAVTAVGNPSKVEELSSSPKEVLTAIFAIMFEGLLVRKGKRS